MKYDIYNIKYASQKLMQSHDTWIKSFWILRRYQASSQNSEPDIISSLQLIREETTSERWSKFPLGALYYSEIFTLHFECYFSYTHII